MSAKPDQPDEVAPTVEEEATPSRSLADRISEIGSGQDVKDIIDDGLDKLKHVTVDDVLETGKGLGARIVGRIARGFDEATRKD